MPQTLRNPRSRAPPHSHSCPHARRPGQPSHHHPTPLQHRSLQAGSPPLALVHLGLGVRSWGKCEGGTGCCVAVGDQPCVGPRDSWYSPREVETRPGGGSWTVRLQAGDWGVTQLQISKLACGYQGPEQNRASGDWTDPHTLPYRCALELWTNVLFSWCKSGPPYSLMQASTDG